MSYDADVQRLRIKVLQLARDLNADSDVVAGAMADVLATIAAMSDVKDGRQGLKDRLHAFCERVEATHKRMMSSVPVGLAKKR